MAGNGEILTAITGLSNSLNSRIDQMSQGLNERIDNLGISIHKRINLVEKKAEDHPERPCLDLTNHLGQHQESKRMWIGEVIRGIVALVVILLGAYLIYRWKIG